MRGVVLVCCSADYRITQAAPEDLTLLAVRGTKAGEGLTAGDLVAASQASLNEIVAAIIRTGAGPCKLLAGRKRAQCVTGSATRTQHARIRLPGLYG